MMKHLRHVTISIDYYDPQETAPECDRNGAFTSKPGIGTAATAHSTTGTNRAAPQPEAVYRTSGISQPTAEAPASIVEQLKGASLEELTQLIKILLEAKNRKSRTESTSPGVECRKCSATPETTVPGNARSAQRPCSLHGPDPVSKPTSRI